MPLKNILVVTPRFPLPTLGACEQDRLNGLKQLKRLGFNVRVLAKVFAFQDKEAIIRWGRDNGIIIDLIDYETRRFFLRRLSNPFYWDGAAYEYSHKNTRALFELAITKSQPDVIWFDYTYLWPLYSLAEKFNIPIITRSINFEPFHFLQEDGYSVVNLLKFIPKLISELIVILKSDVILAITPKEKRIYQCLGAKKVLTLPLRGLPGCLKQARDIAEKERLDVFFMGSTYGVHHNRKAVEFLIKEVAPEVEKKSPGRFVFHILGTKLPADLEKYLNEKVVYEGQVENLDQFLQDMDMAIIPSLMGAGMQQKIFEPLARGIPTITSPRGLVGYPFRDRKHLLLARDKEEFVEKIISLQDINLRGFLSVNALDLCLRIFSQGVLDGCVLEALKKS